MKIVIDLDNTLFYNDVVDVECARYGYPRTTRHDLKDLPDFLINKCYDEFKNVERMNSFNPIDDALGVDKMLSDAGHYLIVITSRDKLLEEGTTEMLKTHFPYINELHVIESYNKQDLYDELVPDVVIDDHSDHIYQALDAEVEYVFMVSNKNTTYNHSEVQGVLDRGAIVVKDVSFLCKFFGMK